MTSKDAYHIYFAANVRLAQSQNIISKAALPDGGKDKFKQTLSKHLTLSDQIKAHSAEKRRTLAHIAETLRAESAEQRQRLMGLWMQKDEDEKPYDVLGKCLDIARRIMRGERVSAEDMRFLAQHYPQLLFQALLLRKEEEDQEECECPPENENDGESVEDSLLSARLGGTPNLAGASAPVAGETAVLGEAS